MKLGIVNRAGKDAARAYGTGCFTTHKTHDLRGLTDRELQVRIRTGFPIVVPLPVKEENLTDVASFLRSASFLNDK